MSKESHTKTLLFGEGLLEPTLRGEKQITMRKYRPEAHLFEEGEIFIGKFADGMDLTLQTTAATEAKPFWEISDNEAREDGFQDANDAFEGLKKHYPDLTSETIFGLIRFQIHKKRE